MTEGSRLYRARTAEGATHLDLLLATYDGLADDLRFAAGAADAEDIADRCKWSHHALLLLGHLESWLPLLKEKALEDSLAESYNYIRTSLLRLQAAPDRDSFLNLSMQICEIRAAWQRKKTETPSRFEISSPNTPDVESSRLTWSA